MNSHSRILLVDDDKTALSLMQELLKGRGFTVNTAGSVDLAIEQLEATAYSVIVTDLKMPRRSGMDLLGICIEKYPETAVILITGHGTIRNAVEALKKGAFEYLSKPVQMDELVLVIEKALGHRRLVTEVSFLKGEIARSKEYLYDTTNDKLQQVYRTVDFIRDEDTSVLIQGESGTGKEMIARLIHDSGRRRDGSFVPLNCGAFPDDLIVSELFGYEKGAFTGAEKRTQGKLEMADGGTLFLDEVNELSPKAQVALLRFIQEREVIPLGSGRRIFVNVRIIAATNSNLHRLVEEGRFREDLYYRINVLPLYLPPLRNRREDILPLASWFLKKLKQSSTRPAEGFSPEAEVTLVNYSWPGNIRELRNCVDRASIICRESQIGPESLFLNPVRSQDRREGFCVDGMPPLSELEIQYIDWVLDRHEGNKTRAADALGISIRNLRSKTNRDSP
jgi:DNA-binding NtrC family response regulator